jgi:DNA-binding PadR family transcriptional regulator
VATSALGFALLALLAKAPNTAYELSRRARRPLGYFWTAQYGQIHPQLRVLCEAGLLSVTSAPGPGPHDKRVYSITDAGLRALASWVAQPPRMEPGRDDMLLKAYAIWTANRADATALMRAQAEEHRKRLAEYEAIHEQLRRAHPGGGPAADHPDFGSIATLRYGIGYERNRLDWCEWLAAQLEQPGTTQPAEHVS